MRKRITMNLLAAVALCTALNAEAYDFESGGIYYNITSETDKTVEVTWGDGYYSGKITIPATVTNSGTTYTVTEIGEDAFYQCTDLTEIIIPDQVVSIDYRAFSCSGLTMVTLGSGLKSLYTDAFSLCNISSINIPDGVTEIGGWAFSWCDNLKSVTLGKGVETINIYAFSKCSSLSEIYSLATVPPACAADCFSGVNTDKCTLYVPEGTADAYKAAYVWKNFYNIVETDFSGIEDIAADAAADVKVYAAAGRIVVENAAAGTQIAVYSADGVQIYGGTVSDTFTEIPAPAGKLYIVKCGNAVFKTVM